MEHEDVYDPALLIQTRDAIRLSSSLFRVYVDQTPVFWSHVLVLADTDPQVFCRTLDWTDPSEFSLTIRMVDLSTFCTSDDEELYDVLKFTVTSLIEVLDPHLERCYSLNIQTANTLLLDFLLRHLQWSDASNMEEFTTSFAVVSYARFRPHRLMQFDFASSPPFGDVTSPFTTLSLVANDVPSPVVTYTASSIPSLTIHQPSYLPFTWADLLRFFNASPVLDSLSLDGVILTVDSGTIMVMEPFEFFCEICVNFRGRRSTACLLSHINIQALSTLKVIIQDRLDMLCLALCPALVGVAINLVLKGECSEITGVDRVFYLLHKVECLDLRDACDAIWEAFRAACRVRARWPGLNKNVCPSLRRLMVSATPVSMVVDLLDDRAVSGYTKLESVHLGLMVDGDDRHDLSWFDSRAIRVDTD
jgi:hypothetical protein